MARSRVDDEEALIPRADTEEYHKTASRKRRVRCCPTCCSIKCWFITFFGLVIASTILFYFVYPTVIHDNFNKFMGLACSAYTDPADETVTCVIQTTPETMMTQALAVDSTWTTRCTVTHYIYNTKPDQEIPQKTKELFTNLYSVQDVHSTKALSMTYNKTVSTAWYLIADDTTFVPYDRLQRLLRMQSVTNYTYLGNKLDSKQDFLQPYVINKILMNALISSQDLEKSQASLVKSVLDSANVSTHWTGFSVGNPLQEANHEKVLNMTLAAYTFTGIKPQEMYAYYIISEE